MEFCCCTYTLAWWGFSPNLTLTPLHGFCCASATSYPYRKASTGKGFVILKTSSKMLRFLFSVADKKSIASGGKSTGCRHRLGSRKVARQPGESEKRSQRKWRWVLCNDTKNVCVFLCIHFPDRDFKVVKRESKSEACRPHPLFCKTVCADTSNSLRLS